MSILFSSFNLPVCLPSPGSMGTSELSIQCDSVTQEEICHWLMLLFLKSLFPCFIFLLLLDRWWETKSQRCNVRSIILLCTKKFIQYFPILRHGNILSNLFLMQSTTKPKILPAPCTKKHLCQCLCLSHVALLIFTHGTFRCYLIGHLNLIHFASFS